MDHSAHLGDTIESPPLFGGSTRPPASRQRLLRPQDYLYCESDARTAAAWRIEKGAIAVFARDIASGTGVDMVIRGKDDFVGLGCLGQHADSARAVTNSIVTPLTGAEFARLLGQDAKLRLEQANSLEREFEHRKSQVLSRGPSAPIARLEAFLVAEYRLRACEGMESSGAGRSFDASAMCSMLGLDEATVAATVQRLEALHRVEQEGN